MLFLALSILFSVSVFVLFKFIERHQVVNFSAIVVNYIVACLAGFFLSKNSLTLSQFSNFQWLPIALVVGVLYILMFYVMAQSTQKVGVAVTTVAVKMSVIFPMVFSIWFDAHDTLSVVKIFGIGLALIAVFLTVYNKSNQKLSGSIILLPAILFVGMGLVDSFVKYAQTVHISANLASTFSAMVFGFALLVGLMVLPFNKPALYGLKKGKTWFWGLLLGFVNFGTVYFLLLALNQVHPTSGNQVAGSVVFGINNISIVALSVIVGFLAYKERPTWVNWSGIGLSVVAIVMLALS